MLYPHQIFFSVQWEKTNLSEVKEAARDKTPQI